MVATFTVTIMDEVGFFMPSLTTIMFHRVGYTSSLIAVTDKNFS